MLKYVGLRVLQAIPVLIGITIASFLLIHIIPGDPARIQLGPHATAAQVTALRRQLGLERPLLDQYITFLGGAIHLDFGQSLAVHQPVGAVIRSKAGVTLLLLVYSLVLSLVFAGVFGILSAIKQDTAIDHAIRGVGMVLFVMPMFWIGLVLILVFGLKLGWFPTEGYEPGLGGVLHSLTLPALALSFAMAPLFVRSLRASIIQTLGSPFVEAARARGFSERRVMMRHTIRNASISTITLVGLTVSAMLSWTVLVENVFSLPGLGQQLVAAVSSRDFTMVQGMVVVLASAVVIVNLLTDLTYAAIDPRVRL
jgi:peptide/nickel transport system permease protein